MSRTDDRDYIDESEWEWDQEWDDRIKSNKSKREVLSEELKDNEEKLNRKIDKLNSDIQKEEISKKHIDKTNDLKRYKNLSRDYKIKEKPKKNSKMNLLDFNGVDDEVLKSLITNVEVMNSKNMASQYANTGHRKAINLKNKLVSIIGRGEESPDPETISLEVMTQKLIEELEWDGRATLENRLKKSLHERIKKDYSISERLDESELEEKMLLITAEKYDLNPELSKSRKIELISQEFKKGYSKIISKQLSEMDDAQEKRFDDLINEELGKASPEVIKNLKEHLNIEELNSEAIRGVLKSSGGALAFLAIPTIGGFSSYVAMTTIMHALFTTFLGITLPFAFYTSATSLLAFLTGPVGWAGAIGLSAFSVKKGMKNMTNTVIAQVVGILSWIYEEEILREIRESLPSNRSDEEYEELKKFKREYDKSERKIAELQMKLNKKENKIQQIERAQEEKNRQLVNEKKSLESQLREISDSKRRLQDRSNEEDVETVEELWKELDEKEQIILEKTKENEQKFEKYEEQIVDLEVEKERIAEENKQLGLQLNDIDTKLDEKVTFKAIDLEKEWKKRFKRLEIKRKIIKEVTKQYQHDREVMLNIELALQDIDYSKSPLNTRNERGKMKDTGENHVNFTADDAGRIYYTILNVEVDEIKKKRINEIGKHR